MHKSGPAPLTSPGWTDDRRKSRHERGYGTAWDKLRLRILDRDNHLCQCPDCVNRGLYKPATEVDHIINKGQWLRERGTLAGVDVESNLQAMNKACHKLKTQAEARAATGGRMTGGDG